MPDQTCVFCQIVRGAEASIVYEDDHTMAFMNLRQANPGHVLVIPKRHIEQVYDLDEDMAGHVGRAVAKVARAIRSALGTAELNIWQSNGADAGQEIFHLHVHLFPRVKADGFFQVYPNTGPLPEPQSRAYLDKLAEQIRLHAI